MTTTKLPRNLNFPDCRYRNFWCKKDVDDADYKVCYTFADPELEALSAGHKILVRIGHYNAIRIKNGSVSYGKH